jgi:hypothetical protein
MESVMKEQVITFKVDRELQKALDRVPNKSEFIRNAILESLGNRCPLCSGTGILNEQQKKHWDSFMEHHSIEECSECRQVHIKCEYE